MLQKRASFFFLFAYITAAIALLPRYKYSFQADTLQYVTIAIKYSNGFFAEAINSYWSPLFSWLIAIILKLGVEPFSAILILQIILGAVLLYGVFTLIPFEKENAFFLSVLYLSIIVLVLSFVLLVPTPDLLLTTIGVWYMILLQRTNYYFNRKASFLVFGLLGTLLYFAKAAGFFIFILSFSIYNFYYFLNAVNSGRKIILKYFLSLSVFLLLSSFWIAAISKKDKKVLISSTTEYNFNLVGPKTNPSVFGVIHHPFEWTGLNGLADENSLSTWEEPHKMQIEKWSPFDSMGNFLHYIKVIVRNLISIQSFYLGLDAGTIPLVGILILFFINKSELRNFFSENLLPIIIGMSFTIPYLFVLVMDRHVWINNMVICILAISLLKILLRHNKTIATMFFLLFCFATIYTSAYELSHPKDDYKFIFDTTQELAKNISGNTASLLTKEESGEENYIKSTIVNYLSHSKYYGMLRVPEHDSKMVHDLRRYDIDYLLVWNKTYGIPDSLYTETKSYNCGVIVYKLKKP